MRKTDRIWPGPGEYSTLESKGGPGMLKVASVILSARMGWGYNDGGWFWMALMMIGGAILIIVIVYLLVRQFYSHNVKGPGAEQTPLEVARRRYAAGEITSEEFEKIKKDIGEGGQ